MAAQAPLSIQRLSSLSTSTLSSILELTRAHQLSLPAQSLTSTVARNITTLHSNLQLLRDQGEAGEAFKGLEAQYDRLVDLVTPLGVQVPERRRAGREEAGSRTGRLVDTGEDEEGDQQDLGDESGFALEPIGPKDHTAVNLSHDPATNAALDQLEEDEDEMRRANAEVLQMQRRMLDDQDETLDSLSSAIARQHSLSINIAEELEAQEALLDETDNATDRTHTNLRRASGRLNDYTRRAKETGSTGLIVLLVVILVVLIVLFK